MKTNIARVCHIGTTNYVEYKGKRYTVKEYNKTFKTKVEIPKGVKVCRNILNNITLEEVNKLKTTTPIIQFKEHGSKEKQLEDELIKSVVKETEYLHGSRAKKERINNLIELGMYDKAVKEIDDIDTPKNLRLTFTFPGLRKKYTAEVYFQAVCILIILASLIIHSLQH
jgi:hypothetical protein